METDHRAGHMAVPVACGQDRLTKPAPDAGQLPTTAARSSAPRCQVGLRVVLQVEHKRTAWREWNSSWDHWEANAGQNQPQVHLPWPPHRTRLQGPGLLLGSNQRLSLTQAFLSDSGFLQDPVSKNVPFPCFCLPTTPFPVSFVICLWSAGLTSQLMQRLWEGQIGFPAFAEQEDTAGRSWSRR